ncbi:MAG: glycosyltransferase family 2 protein [Gemmatimonadaceae bacterium]
MTTTFSMLNDDSMTQVEHPLHHQGVPVGPGVPDLVSVVIPSYNRARLVGGAIESVMSQTWPYVEALVIDDGSTDETEAAVAPYVEKYGERVRYVRKPNGGVASARNVGFTLARGEFIALLDSDDLWLPWKAAVQVELMRRYPDVGMVWTDLSSVTDSLEMLEPAHLRTFYHNYQRVRIEDLMQRGGGMGELGRSAPGDLGERPFYVGDIFSGMFLGSLVHTSTAVLRRERLQRAGGFDESFRRAGEDYEFHLRTTFCGPVGFVDASSILYRVGNADQITSHALLHIARGNLATVLRWQTIGRHRLTLTTRAITERIAESHAWVGDVELRQGDRGAARTAFMRSLRAGPPDLRRLGMLFVTLMPRKLVQTVVDLRRRARDRLRRGPRGLAHA